MVALIIASKLNMYNASWNAIAGKTKFGPNSGTSVSNMIFFFFQVNSLVLTVIYSVEQPCNSEVLMAVNLVLHVLCCSTWVMCPSKLCFFHLKGPNLIILIKNLPFRACCLLHISNFVYINFVYINFVSWMWNRGNIIYLSRCCFWGWQILVSLSE